MKKNILTMALTSFFFVLSMMLTAQTDPPPDPGDDPESGSDPPLGGSAPIGGGALILIGLGAAYGSKKVYKLFKDNQEELED
ncbi:MAG: hypothetical protein DRJ05_09985 [Bacteroidetes bacterium]|nr:MAG: hypothetical protein DRI89_08650 [Bacteroidota bacterium]RLD57262.1 MAG: hypothetical protein DRJ05_09985 [Bacteroidota bacterium]